METFTSRLSYRNEWPMKLHTQNGMEIDFSKPPQYRGLHGTLTPEDAFIGSIIMCIAATFDTYASKMHLKILDFDSEGRGVVDKVDGKWRFSKIDVKVKITIPRATNVKAIQKAIQKAQDNCLVSASISSPIAYDVQIIETES